MIKTHCLDNGLRIALDPGGSAPVASVQLWFDTGSARELASESGVAHLLEHMLFKASTGLPSGEAVAQLEALGGAPNAWTSLEETVLFCTIPARHAPRAVELLARMGTTPALQEEDLVPERGVVLEEIREAEDDPTDLLAERLRQRVFGDHPYARPILGTVETVSVLDAAALRRAHSGRYCPGNTTLVVAGPVDEDAVLAAARAWLSGTGDAEPRKLPPTPLEPVQPGAFVLDPGFDERLVEVAVPIPPLDHEDTPALDLLAMGLGDGASAKLAAVLRHEKNLCMSCWASLENGRSGGIFVAGLAAREGQLAEATEALLRELKLAAEEGLSPSALRKAKASVLADRLRDQETVDGRASRAGWYMVNKGRADADLAYEAAIQRVVPADVQRVARRWLDPARWVVGALAPSAELDEAKAKALLASVRALPARVSGATRTAVVRRRLDCGATLLVEPDASAEMFGLSVIGVGGAIAAGPRDAGLAGAWASVAMKGAGHRDALAFASAVEERAGSLRAWTSRNSFGVQLSMPDRELDSGLGLLADLILRPRFSGLEVERVRADLLELQRTVLDDAGDLAGQLTWQGLFPGHPWGRPSIGTAASVARLSEARLRRYHRRMFQGRNLVFGMAGAVDPDEAEQMLNAVFADLPAGDVLPLAPPVVPGRFRRHREGVIGRERSPTELVLAFPSVGAGHPDEPAVRLLEAILGGASGGMGRLFDRLREQEGLTYSVFASAHPGLGGGAFVCGVTTDPGREAQALAALWEELHKVVREPMPTEELERIRSSIEEGARAGVERAITRADSLAAAERYRGKGESWKDVLLAPCRVSEEDLRRVARGLLRADRCVTIRVGPERHEGNRA